jgi:WD40 repeat protein
VFVYNVSGQCISKFQPQKWSLGVKTLNWSPSGQLLAIGSYDQKVRLLNHITYSMIMELEHPLKISSKDLVRSLVKFIFAFIWLIFTKLDFQKVIFKEIDGNARMRKDFSNSLLSESANLTENELMSIYSTPSKCNSS